MVEHLLHREESRYMDLEVLLVLKIQAHSNATPVMVKVILLLQGQTAIQEILQTAIDLEAVFLI